MTNEDRIPLIAETMEKEAWRVGREHYEKEKCLPTLTELYTALARVAIERLAEMDAAEETTISCRAFPEHHNPDTEFDIDAPDAGREAEIAKEARAAGAACFGCGVPKNTLYLLEQLAAARAENERLQKLLTEYQNSNLARLREVNEYRIRLESIKGCLINATKENDALRARLATIRKAAEPIEEAIENIKRFNAAHAEFVPPEAVNNFRAEQLRKDAS